MNAFEAFGRGWHRGFQNDPPEDHPAPEGSALERAYREHPADTQSGWAFGRACRAWDAAGRPWPLFADGDPRVAAWIGGGEGRTGPEGWKP